jgi:hypothetical protein
MMIRSTPHILLNQDIIFSSLHLSINVSGGDTQKQATQLPSTKHINAPKHHLLNIFIFFPWFPCPSSPPFTICFLSLTESPFVNCCFLVY